MKVLFIVNDFPPILGGQSTYLYNMCKSLPPDRIVVLAPKHKGDKEFDKLQKFKIIRKPYLFSIQILEKFFKIVLPLFYALPIIRKYNIKTICCAHVLSTGIVGLVLKKIFGKSFFVITHSSDILEYQKHAVIKKLLIVILKNTTCVLTNSEFTKKKLLELSVPAKKIIKVYPRIDLEKYNKNVNITEIIRRYNLEKKKIILSVNRLIERKGNDMVIRALPRIKNAIPNVI